VKCKRCLSGSHHTMGLRIAPDDEGAIIRIPGSPRQHRALKKLSGKGAGFVSCRK